MEKSNPLYRHMVSVGKVKPFDPAEADRDLKRFVRDVALLIGASIFVGLAIIVAFYALRPQINHRLRKWGIELTAGVKP